VITVEVEPDGLSFDANSIQSERITEDADYEGFSNQLTIQELQDH